MYRIQYKVYSLYCTPVTFKMQTRSQTKTRSQLELHKPLYTVDIDFDGASEAWKKNKRSRGNGTYIYICGQTTKTGTTCNKVRANGCDYCNIHSKK